VAPIQPSAVSGNAEAEMRLPCDDQRLAPRGSAERVLAGAVGAPDPSFVRAMARVDGGADRNVVVLLTAVAGRGMGDRSVCG
jgi:hypothetical protein